MTPPPDEQRAFPAELDRYGPGCPRGSVPTLAEARRYCRRLARHHYENFTVASWCAPAPLRQHLCHIYAYCRWADDLADEVARPADSLALLDWWQQQLEACYAGSAEHPVFVALQETIRQFAIPAEPFQDLLSAFRQDQLQTRYETFAQLLDYCRRSANPVGRLVLYLGRCATPPAIQRSDSICTGLQLANFWQDLAEDWDRGRLYVPAETRVQFGYDDAMLQGRLANEPFRRMLAFEAARAEAYLVAGRPLEALMPPPLRVEVRLAIDGGLAILAALRRIDYDVWSRRPTVGKLEKLLLLLRAGWGVSRR